MFAGVMERNFFHHYELCCNSNAHLPNLPKMKPFSGVNNINGSESNKFWY